MKRLLSLLLSLCIILTMIPVSKANAAGNIVINGVDIGYADGSYFTKNGASCANSYWPNGRCHNNNVCTSATHVQCNCMRYWPTGDPSTCQVDLLGAQCFAFARYCQWKVYGSFATSVSSSYSDLTGSLSKSSCTESTLKSKLYGCAPATHIRMPSPHSISVISTTDEGITYADCNTDGYCRVAVWTQTWSEFAKYVQGKGGITYSYSRNGVIPSPANDPVGYVDGCVGGVQSVTVSGWAFDEDDVNAQLEIHVYIGDLSGSYEVYGAAANGYRPDVNNVYGVGDYHGFTATFKTNLTGSQPVRIYAINVGSGGNVLLGETTVSITPDTTAPVISNVSVSEMDATGYTVRCTVTDNTGVSRVRFPTWTEPQQDDLLPDWGENPACAGTKNGNSYTFRVNISDHNNETTGYVTHIYAWDNYGNYSCIGIGGQVNLAYTIAYDANGGTGVPASQTKTHGVSMTLSTAVPTWTGYTFLGWSASSDAATADYQPGDAFTANANTTLYAVWKEDRVSITYQPMDQKVVEGTYATFTVEAAGSGLSYQWQYRSSSSGTWKNTTQSGNKTAALTIPGTVGRNGYQYRCVVTNSAGSVITSGAATLTVEAVLAITSQPESVTAATGDAVSFTVAADGTGLIYQWEYRSSANGTWKTTTLTGNKTATLKAAATTARNGFQYRCKVTDSIGNVAYSDAATLYVLGIKTQPESKTVTAGTNVKFTVAATGNGLTYQWEYRASSSGTWKTTTQSGNKTATLTIPGTASRNGYQYRVKITDSAGNVIYSNAAALTVQ